MKPEIAKLWVAALRSGTYQQGQGRLRGGGNCFCCLGVLCDLHSKETGIQWEDEGNGRHGCMDDAFYISSTTSLPDEVKAWAGASSCNPSVPSSWGQINLAVLNDGPEAGAVAPLNFNQIADLIELHAVTI